MLKRHVIPLETHSPIPCAKKTKKKQKFTEKNWVRCFDACTIQINIILPKIVVSNEQVEEKCTPLPPLPNRFPAARLSPKIIGPWYNWPPENCLLENLPLVRLPSGEFPTSIIILWRITPWRIVLETPSPPPFFEIYVFKIVFLWSYRKHFLSRIFRIFYVEIFDFSYGSFIKFGKLFEEKQSLLNDFADNSDLLNLSPLLTNFHTLVRFQSKGTWKMPKVKLVIKM